MPSGGMNRLFYWWKRGVTLMLTLWLAQLFAGGPFAVVGFLCPEEALTGNQVVFALMVVLLVVSGPLLFYGSCRFVGLTLTDWAQEDRELADEHP